jgi:hypothetical protein
MTTVLRSLPAGTIPLGQCHDLTAEIAAKAGVIGSLCTGISISGGDPNDEFAFSFDGAPDDVALDAAIAAYPSTSQPPQGQFAGTANTTYTIREIPLAPGQHIAFTVLAHLRTGSIAASRCEVARAFGCAHRQPNGTIVVPRLATSVAGTVPGFDLHVTATATGILISYSVRASEDFEMLWSEVEILNSQVVA